MQTCIVNVMLISNAKSLERNVLNARNKKHTKTNEKQYFMGSPLLQPFHKSMKCTFSLTPSPLLRAYF